MTTTISKKNKHTKPVSKKRTGKRIGMRNTKKHSKNSKKSKTSKKNKPKNRLYKGGFGENEFREHMNYVIERTKQPFTKPKSKETQDTGFNPVYNFNNQKIDENIKTIDTIFVNLVYHINKELKDKKLNIDRLKKILDQGLINTKFNRVLNGDYGIHKLVLKIYTYYNYHYLLSIKNVNYTLVDEVIQDVLYKYNEAIAEYDKLTDYSSEVDMSIIRDVYKDIAYIVYNYYKDPTKKSRFNTLIENPTTQNIHRIGELENTDTDINTMVQLNELNDRRVIAPNTIPSVRKNSSYDDKAEKLEKTLRELRNDSYYTSTINPNEFPEVPTNDPTSKGSPPNTSKTPPPPKPPRTGKYSLKGSPKK